MYCINCGEKLVQGAKYCHHCGTRQPSSTTKSYPPVQEELISKPPHLDGPKSIEETMHSTHDLVDLIQEVDEKINIDLTRHETDQTEDNPNFIGPKKEKNQEPKNPYTTQPVKKLDFKEEDTPPSKESTRKWTLPKLDKAGKKEEKIKLQEESPQEGPKEEKKEEKNPSSSFLDKVKVNWHKFIHEEDDQYSIFSALNKKENDQEKLAREKEITDAEKLPMSSLEQKVSPESLDYTQESILLEELLQEEEIQWKQEKEQRRQERKNQERLKKLAQKNFAREQMEDDGLEGQDAENQGASASQKFVFKPKNPGKVFSQLKKSTAQYFGFDEDNSDLPPAEDKKEDLSPEKNKKLEETKDAPESSPAKGVSFSSKLQGLKKKTFPKASFPEKKKEEKAKVLEEVSETNLKEAEVFDAGPGEKAAFQEEKSGEAQKVPIPPKAEKPGPDQDSKVQEEPLEKKAKVFSLKKPSSKKTPQAKDSSKEEKMEKIDAYMEKVNLSIADLLEKIHGLGPHAKTILFVLGLVFCCLPLVLVGWSTPILSLVFALLKIVASLFIFYTAHRMAYGSIEATIPENLRKIGILTNWALCQVVLFILFLFYPKSSTLGYNMLGAVTPNILGTLILYLLTIFFASGLFWQRFKGKSRIQFIGWYAVTFISLELISKIIWILLNFLTSLA